VRIVDPLLAEIDQEAATTRRVLERVPTDKLAWKPHPKSMSLGQLATHVAGTPGTIAKFIEKDIFEMGDMQEPEPATTAAILVAHEASVAAAKAMLNTFTDAQMMASWSFVAGGKTMMTMRRIACVRAIMLNHWYHHRGQLSVYLRLLDVPVPSIYGPSADENPWA
jgi:uncharacterized damage-inducible protein DinB